MVSDNESYNSESEFYYLDEDFRHFRHFHSNPVEKKIYTFICRPSAVRIGKNCARGLRYGSRRAASGHVRPAASGHIQDLWLNNVYFCVLFAVVVTFT